MTHLIRKKAQYLFLLRNNARIIVEQELQALRFTIVSYHLFISMGLLSINRLLKSLLKYEFEDEITNRFFRSGHSGGRFP